MSSDRKMRDRGALGYEEAIRATGHDRTNASVLRSHKLGLQPSGCHGPSGTWGLGPMETVRGSKPGDCFIRVAVHQSRHRSRGTSGVHPLIADSPGTTPAAQWPLQRLWRRFWR